MVIIDADRSLSNIALYEHRCLENIKKLYKLSEKCDDKQKYKSMIEANMVSTPEEFNENSPMSSGQSVPAKQYFVRKSLRQFTETFDIKPKTSLLRMYILLNQSAKQS